MSDGTKLEIKPVVRGSEIVSIKVENESLALKKPIPLVDFPHFIEMLEAISEYVDFKGEASWTYEDIVGFLDDISENALSFFEIIIADADWVSREHILGIMDVNSNTLAGSLSSPGQYFSRHRKDAIYQKEWKRENRKYALYYRVKPEYLDLMERAIKEV